MRVASLETVVVSVPYRHREVSSRVRRDGVTDVLVKVGTDDGLVGWGESCSGADVVSVEAAIRAMAPFVLGRDPWAREAIAADVYGLGLWDYRPMTANFAFSGIDMALLDLCGQACEQPVYNLFGGLRRASADYFCYLSAGDPDDVAAQCRAGVERGYTVFYIKVGIDFAAELELVAAIRKTIGPERKIRVDANGRWSVNEALRNLAALDRFGIDFAEQPVPSEPVRNMAELRARTPVALCANEGLGRVSDCWEVIRRRAADVLCFSSSWVGSLAQFARLAHAAHLEGLAVCKHTHGELGIAAAAHQHVLLTLPNIVDGHQQTAAMMEDDVLAEPLPIAQGPAWGVPRGPGLGIRVDEAKVRKYHEHYRAHGQFLPYQPGDLARDA
ncbi:MAG TPA: mandelate racemase/muconate lactonizing enzyme family protein [Gammaproteobacteria bacterium]|nr:mandelate racemase/muconate lactonizing enzyme family protein [Gammaproteobacteria bacterium]